MSISNLYLKHLKVDNYKSLKSSSIELQMGLNIIIGKNGAGKSNLLEFISRYTNTLTLFSPRNINTSFSLSIAYNSDKKENILSFDLEKIKKSDALDGTVFLPTFELTIKKLEKNKLISVRKMETYPQHLTMADKDLDVLDELQKNYIEFSLPKNIPWISEPIRLTIDETVTFDKSFFSPLFFNDLESQIKFENLSYDLIIEAKKGANSLEEFLTVVLNTYLERIDINYFLANYTPIKEIRFNPNLLIYSNNETTIVENLSIDFLIDGNWMPWSYLSDGTKRLFYLISECIALDQGIILIEEPELGVHPHQLEKILTFLKEQSITKQVIISTHSPLVLDILKEDELDRITIAKYEKGTRFYKLNKKETDKAKKYINEVGELSYYWLHSDLEK